MSALIQNKNENKINQFSATAKPVQTIEKKVK